MAAGRVTLPSDSSHPQLAVEIDDGVEADVEVGSALDGEEVLAADGSDEDAEDEDAVAEVMFPL